MARGRLKALVKDEENKAKVEKAMIKAGWWKKPSKAQGRRLNLSDLRKTLDL